MAKYMYFVITPGVDPGSYVEYPDEKQGNYFKFGDTSEETQVGIRTGYTTHNPDIGIAAVLENDLNLENLGTKITKDILTDGFDRVPRTEWFSVPKDGAWALFKVMMKWDGTKIDDSNYDTFKKAVLAALNNSSGERG